MRSTHDVDSKTFDVLSYSLIALYFIFLVWSASVPWLTEWQTSLSSAHAITAGKHFAKDGFITCKFLPILQPGKLYGEYYLHYPPLTDILAGVIRKSGFDSLFSFRFPPIVFATIALLFWFLFVKQVFNSEAAFFCLLFLTVFPEYYVGVYSPHIFSLDQFFRFAALYLVYLLFNVEEINKKRISYLLWLVMFFQSITSIEYIIYLQLYLWLCAFFFNVPKKKKLIWFFSAPGLGIILHLLQDVWAVGIYGLIWDIVNTASYKAGGLENVGYSVMLLKSLKMYFWSYITILGIEKSIYFVILFIGVAIISLYELKKYHEIKSFLYYLVIFFICEIYWYFLFPKHALVHIHVIRILLPSTTFLIGILFYANVKTSKKLWNSKNTLALTKTLIVICAFVTLYGYKIYGLAEVVKYNFTTPVSAYEFRELKKLIPEDAICLTSYFTYDACYMRFYLDRRTYATPIKVLDSQLALLEKEPFYNKDNLYYIYHRSIDRVDFKDNKLLQLLLAEKVVVIDQFRGNPAAHVYFNSNIKNEDQLRKRLVQIGVSDTEHILNLWRKSFQDTPEQAKKYLPSSAKFLFMYKDFLYVYKLFN